MKKNILTLTFIVSTFAAYSQVGIGTLEPDNASMLDVVAGNKGILIPRVNLLSIYDVTTVVGSVNGKYENSLLVFNKTNNSAITPGFYYWYENRWSRLLNQEDFIKMSLNVRNNAVNVVNEVMVITDTEGNSISIPISALNIVTTLVNNQNGTYSYTSENGTETLIDVPTDVQNNFQQIVNNQNVQGVLNQIITQTKHLVKFDGTNFNYIDDNGLDQTISWEDLVQTHQKKYQLVNGENTQVESLTDVNNTIWKVNVNKASGATNNQVSTLGVVKESDTNPLITINQAGALSLNYENINQVKEINTNYTISSDDSILLGNASQNSINITLPNAAYNKGKRLIVKKEDANEDFYINVFGTIQGVQHTLYTALPYSGWEFLSDGSKWRIINKF